MLSDPLNIVAIAVLLALKLHKDIEFQELIVECSHQGLTFLLNTYVQYLTEVGRVRDEIQRVKLLF